MAKLDDLPQELKELILCAAPDIATLKCLAHLSPLFYDAYRRRRENTFATVIATELTPVILHEARYVVRASFAERGPSWLSDVEQLLGDYTHGTHLCIEISACSPRCIHGIFSIDAIASSADWRQDESALTCSG